METQGDHPSGATTARHLFSDRIQAQAALRSLESHGFTPAEIAVVVRQPSAASEGARREPSHPFGDGSAGTTLLYLTAAGTLVLPTEAGPGNPVPPSLLAAYGLDTGDAGGEWRGGVATGYVLVAVRAAGAERAALAGRLLRSADLGPAGQSTETRLSPGPGEEA